MTDEPDALRVLAYVRQSKGRDGETEADSLSLDAQAKAIARMCDDRGWNLVDIIRDHDLKGDNPDRPGLATMLNRARTVNAVAVFAMSRLARDNLLQETIWRQLRTSGSRLISVTEPAAEDDMVRGILGVVAQAERQRMGRFISSSLRTKQERGQYVGHRPYGMIFNKETHILAPHPQEAPVVCRVAREILAGKTFQVIMKDLALDGIGPPRGAHWNTQNFKRVFTNPALAGLIRLKSDGTLVPGIHEPILDRATWEAVCAAFKPGQRIRTKPTSSFAEGLVRHACGSRMYLYANELKYRTNPVLFRTFRCKNYRMPGDRCNDAKREVSANRIEWAILRCLAYDLSAVIPVATARADWRRDNVANLSDRKRVALLNKRAMAEEKHRNARTRWYEGKWSDELMDEADARLSASIAEVDAEIAALPAEPDWDEIDAFARDVPQIAEHLFTMSDLEVGNLTRRLGHLVWDGDTATMRYSPNIALLIVSPVVLTIPKRVA